jgi:putative FmdB family regulatory protein
MRGRAEESADAPAPRTFGVRLSAMPIYEYVCMQCESHFEELVRGDVRPDCPDCGASNVRKQFSVFATHGGGE